MKACCKIAWRDAIILAQMRIAGVAAAEPNQTIRAAVDALVDKIADLKEAHKRWPSR